MNLTSIEEFFLLVIMILFAFLKFLLYPKCFILLFFDMTLTLPRRGKISWFCLSRAWESLNNKLRVKVSMKRENSKASNCWPPVFRRFWGLCLAYEQYWRLGSFKEIQSTRDWETFRHRSFVRKSVDVYVNWRYGF